MAFIYVHKLVTNFACQLFGFKQVAQCFLFKKKKEAFSVKTAAKNDPDESCEKEPKQWSWGLFNKKVKWKKNKDVESWVELQIQATLGSSLQWIFSHTSSHQTFPEEHHMFTSNKILFCELKHNFNTFFLNKQLYSWLSWK